MKIDRILNIDPIWCVRKDRASTFCYPSGEIMSIPYPLPADFCGCVVLYYNIYALEYENKILCSDCSVPMHFRSYRWRKVKDADLEFSSIVMVPRFTCPVCKKARIMHPYFLYGRKQFSLVAIEQIVSEDASTDPSIVRDISAFVSGATIRNNRRWVIQAVHEIFAQSSMPNWFQLAFDELSLTIAEGRIQSRKRRETERYIIRILNEKFGDNWLTEIFRTYYGSPETDLSLLRVIIE